MNKVKSHPRLAKKMIDAMPGYPGNTDEDKLRSMVTTLQKVASAKQDNVDPDDGVLAMLRQLAHKAYKDRHLTEEVVLTINALLFKTFVTLFGGKVGSFATFVSQSEKINFEKLTNEHDLRTAAYNIDLKEDQMGRFPVIRATLNWGNKQYKAVLLFTPANIEKIRTFSGNGNVGFVELQTWGDEPHGYRYLEKKDLKTNFTIVSRKETSVLH